MVRVPFGIHGQLIGVRLGLVGIEDDAFAPVAVDSCAQHMVVDILLIGRAIGHLLRSGDAIFKYPHLQVAVVSLAETALSSSSMLTDEVLASSSLTFVIQSG